MLIPLAPFEEYMFLDGTDSYPMNCFLRFEFSGQFDRERFQRAWERTLPFHPLLQSRIVSPRKNRYVWDLDGPPGSVCWQENADRHENPCGKPYDLFFEPPFRMTVRQFCDGGSELFAESHHSVLDAIGAMQFFEQLLDAYHRDLPPENPDQKILVSALNARYRFAKNLRELLCGVPSQLFGLARAWYFLMRRPEPVVPCNPPLDRPAPPEGFPFLLQRSLNPTQTALLRERAGQRGASINDCLLAAAFRALFDWRKNENIPETEHFLRIAVPVNLRNHPAELSTAANRVSMVFIDRKCRSADNFQKLLSGIHREMQHIKRHRLGWAFIFGLACFKNVFGGFHGMIHQKRCWSSCVLTNPGRVFQKTALPLHDGKIRIDGAANGGRLQLEKMISSPPIRPWTVFGINVVTYHDEMFLTLHYDPVAVSREAAERFFDLYVDTVIR
ncbi:MAG: hypothetical protein FWC50_07775 [Planctomycetaceae bacterium]|nr:hypothetical protein [Planctomycetaceae bacterium]